MNGRDEDPSTLKDMTDEFPVALSRAKEGLFILGNAPQLAVRSSLWRRVIEELEKEDSLGEAFPITCHRHPESTTHISTPGKLSEVAPDGELPHNCCPEMLKLQISRGLLEAMRLQT
jgi:hypothetical protein